MKKIKVLLVEDRDIIRDILKLSLSGIDDIEITAEAADGQEAIDLVQKNDYDVILMDINLPKVTGIEATRRILKLKPDIKILGTSFDINIFTIRELLEAGAAGFILKGENKYVYTDAIKTVCSGKGYLSEEVGHKTYESINKYLNNIF